MPASEPDISVIVMAFDEAQTLPEVVEDLRGVLGSLGAPDSPGSPGRLYEIIIVDDGSSDGTSQVADRLAGQAPEVSVIHHEANLGLGGVYRTGFSVARGTYLTFFPADGQFPAAIVEQFLPLMADHDLVMGYLSERPSTFTAKVLSWVERVLYKVMFRSFPQFQGIFMVRRALLEKIDLCSSGRGWGIVMELVLKTTRGDYRTVSVPTEIRPRTTGRSKVRNPSTIWANLKQLLTIRRYL